MKVNIEAKYIKGIVDLEIGHYADGSIALHAFQDGEPAFKATVWIQNKPRKGNFVYLKGWSENEGIPQALEDAGIVKLTGVRIPIGYCNALEAVLLIDTEFMKF